MTRIPDMRVLVVDDDEAVARFTSRVLQRLGHVVESYTRPEDALERVTGRPSDFDLVITDHRMPGMTGAELLHRMHQAGVYVPAMVVSGHVEEIDLGALERIGVGSVLRKPYTKAEMEARLMEIALRSKSEPA